MKTLTSIIFILSFSLITFAQSNRDKIKTLKIAYITEKLNLSENEAQMFWPIYNKFEEEDSKLKHNYYNIRKNINFESLTEEKAKQIIKEHRLHNNKKQELENDYITNLTKVISAKKVILLQKIEDDFKRKMFDEYKRRGRH